MADNQSGRSRDAGNRNREQRLQAKRLLGRLEFWGTDDDRGGRAHRRSRQARTRRSR